MSVGKEIPGASRDLIIGPGPDWELTEEAKERIREIEENIRRAYVLSMTMTCP